MCGITGYAGHDFSAQLPHMVRLLEHRGPDDEGMYVHEDIGLGMRRLSIIGLESGHQPLKNRDGSVVMVFNGEIYNYIELTQQLEQSGYKFQTNSDTEVIVHLYDEYGLDFVDHLRGMFGIAIWDSRRKRLVLARDRIGEKPLYFRAANGTLAFGSEIKSILPTMPERSVSHESLVDFMTLGFVSGDKSFFAGINKLAPGSMLTWENGQVDIRQYWSVTSKPDDSLGIQEAESELAASLEDAVRLCLRSDVEVAGFLSGGLDSSLLCALAKKVGVNLRTFSVGYGGEAAGFNELGFARTVSEHLGTTHEELILTPKSNIDLLPKALWHFDEPHGEPTSLLVYQLCEFVAARVKVAIGGTGGDELFFGYPRHKGIRYQTMYSRVPALLRRMFRSVFLSTSRESTTGGRMAKRIRKFLEGAEKTTPQAYSDWIRLCTEPTCEALFGPDVRNNPEDGEIPAFIAAHLDDKFGYEDLMAAAFDLDVHGYLPEYQLAYTDRMSMAASIEVRSPLCDYKIVELAARLRADYKLHGLESKHLLKKVAEPLLPSKIIHRKKVGFDSPIGQWFKSDLREFLVGFLAPDQVEETGLFQAPGVSHIMEQHLSGRRDYSLILWSILAVETWHRMFMEGHHPDADNLALADVRGGR